MSGPGRRSWGWHPLQPEWAQTIVGQSPVRRGDLVLDLGAGTGALTEWLLEAGASVIAVELHPGRLAALRDRYADADVRVVAVDLAQLRLPRRPFRVVASPPYQQSTSLVRALLSTDQLLSADLVLQSAAARRMALAPPSGRHARRYHVERGMAVPRRAFAPPPHVDSAVLKIARRSGRR